MLLFVALASLGPSVPPGPLFPPCTFDMCANCAVATPLGLLDNFFECMWCLSSKDRNRLQHCYNGNPPASNLRGQQFPTQTPAAGGSRHRETTRTPPSQFAPAAVPPLPTYANVDPSLLAAIQATVENGVSRAMQPFSERLDTLTTRMDNLEHQVSAIQPNTAVQQLMRAVRSMERDISATKVMCLGWKSETDDANRSQCIRDFIAKHCPESADQVVSIEHFSKRDGSRSSVSCIEFRSPTFAKKLLQAAKGQSISFDGATVNIKPPRTPLQLERNKALKDAAEDAKKKGASNVSISWQERAVLSDGREIFKQKKDDMGSWTPAWRNDMEI